MNTSRPIKRLLIYRCGQIGDAVAALPSLWLLRETFPNAEFTLLSEIPTKQIHLPPENVFPPDILVQNYIKYQTGRSLMGLFSVFRTLLRIRAGRYDAVAYLLPSIRTAEQRRRDERFFRAAGVKTIWGLKGFADDPYPRHADGTLEEVPHEADALLGRLALDGFPSVSPGMGRTDLHLTASEKAQADAWWQENCSPVTRGKPWFALCFGSKWQSKQWPIELFDRVVREITVKLDLMPVIIGGPEDRDQGLQLIQAWGQGVCAAGELPVRISAALMRHARFYLGNDTGVLHLAAAEKVPCIGIFSSQDWPGRWHPYGLNHHVLRESVTCSGCRIGVCPYDRLCLSRIHPQQVFELCKSVVSQGAPAVARDSDAKRPPTLDVATKTPEGTGSPDSSIKAQPEPFGGDYVTRIVVLTQLTSPYQVEFFNALSKHRHYHLEVIYLTDHDASRSWTPPLIEHAHLVLSRMPHMKKGALESIRRADLTIFNFYTDAFAQKAISVRSSTRKPWAFWGERPGFFRTGACGRIARKVLLRPLHEHPVPIWAIGQFAIEGYQREFGLSRRYSNVPYASDLGRFLSLPKRSTSDRTFLFSGSFSQRKGVTLLAKAFSRIAKLDSSARLVLMGTGPLEGELHQILEDCSDQVTWMGMVPWADLHLGYAKGAIFCFPSRYDGWGLALVEAMAAGMPAIGTRTTGAAIDLIGRDDHRCGWLIPENDEDSLFEAMREALIVPDATLAAMQCEAQTRAKAMDLPAAVERFADAADEVLVQWRARSEGVAAV